MLKIILVYQRYLEISMVNNDFFLVMLDFEMLQSPFF